MTMTSSTDEWLDGLYHPEITDLEMNEHHGNIRPVVYLDEALAHFEKQAVEREALTANRFEVINHLSDGSGREVVVWKGEPFHVETSVQDDGRTVKIFLTDIATLNNSKMEEK